MKKCKNKKINKKMYYSNFKNSHRKTVFLKDLKKYEKCLISPKREKMNLNSLQTFF